MKEKIRYVLLIVLIMILGLSSRKFSAPESWVFLYLGDVLWATMFYFIFRFLFTYKKYFFNILSSITWCFCIEFFQLYQAHWINQIRATLLGSLILGSGFLWSDLVCYTIGVGIGFVIDEVITLRGVKMNEK